MAVSVEERKGAATFRGHEFTVLGRELRVGEAAPDFALIGPGMLDVGLKDWAGKVRIISTVTSLDTPVCSAETRTWEARWADLDGDIALLTVSMDLPPAQARWRAEHAVEHTVASSHKNEQFAIDYGVLIRELRYLQRAVFVVDKSDTIVYVEYVTDISNEPDYDKAIAAARQAAGA